MTITNPGIGALEQLNTLPPDWPGGFWWHWLLFTVLTIAVVFIMLIVNIYIERRGLGRIQARVGPNRTGPFGIFQAVADGVKILTKEFITPANSDKVVFWLAPIVAFAPVFLIFAVVPITDGGLLVDLNIGILYAVAIGSVSTVGVFMAGWSSSNKYSLLGAMRNVAAVVSYEIPMVLAIASVVLIAGSLSLNQIVLAQDIPFILLQPLAFIIVFLAGCAEINRSPFDLMEADSELVAGFHTEYSGMKFAMFYLVEYGEAFVVASIISTLFLGGWRGPVLPQWLWFIIKAILIFFVMVWIRATSPRVRIDQLMALAWKFFFPLALINLFITGILVLTLPEGYQWVMIPVNFALAGVLILLWSRLFKLGWGRVEV